MSVFGSNRPAQGCQKVCCSGFFRTQAMPRDLAGPSLTNDIHTIFARERFAPDIVYVALKPALRLATHLIQASLPFFHSITHHRERVRALGTAMDGRMSYELSSQVEPLTEAQKQLTRDRMTMLAAYMTYRIVPLPNPGEPADEPSGTDFGPWKPEGGYFMDVTIGRSMYRRALNAHNGTVDVARSIFSYFNLARTLVHELAHACTMTSMYTEYYPPARTPSVYFNSSLVAEEGYEWENQTFGGILDPLALDDIPPDHLYNDGRSPYYLISNDNGHARSTFSRMLVLTDWPTLAVVENYRAQNYHIGCRGQLPAVHVKWNVDFVNLFWMFQDSFWEQPKAAGALHFPKVIGHRFSNSAPGQARYFPLVDDDGNADTTTGVPLGYSAYNQATNGGGGLILAAGIQHPYHTMHCFNPTVVPDGNADSDNTGTNDAA